MTLTIGQKILSGFAAVILSIAGLGLYQLNLLDEVRGINSLIVSHDLVVVDGLLEISESQNGARNLREQVYSAALSSQLGLKGRDQSQLQAAWSQAMTDTLGLVDKLAATTDSYAATATSSERGELFRRMSAYLREAAAAMQDVRTETEQQFRLIDDGDIAGALARSGQVESFRRLFLERLRHVYASADELVVAGSKRSDTSYREARQSVLVALALIIALGGLTAYLLRQSIILPLKEFGQMVDRVGRGDLSGKEARERGDEIGRLAQYLNRMVAGLRDVAVQTRAATENLNAATSQIRASTQQQAAGVKEQLAAVQETSATLDEITQSGSQIVRRAKEFTATAELTASASGAGLRAVEDTTRAMDSIREQAESVAENIVVLSEKTQAVGEIIITVNDIAERSHLLALNAAIEAAAAGEHGRSFSVVAAEIKNLADQAKQATSQVRGILSDIQRGINSSVMLTEEAVKRAAYGKEQTDATQSTIHEMTGSIQESVNTFRQIVAAINQQQIGLEQVMLALQNIRLASQQTADGTRQMDGAAANLSALGQQLSTVVSRYQL